MGHYKLSRLRKLLKYTVSKVNETRARDWFCGIGSLDVIMQCRVPSAVLLSSESPRTKQEKKATEPMAKKTKIASWENIVIMGIIVGLVVFQ